MNNNHKERHSIDAILSVLVTVTSFTWNNLRIIASQNLGFDGILWMENTNYKSYFFVSCFSFKFTTQELTFLPANQIVKEAGYYRKAYYGGPITSNLRYKHVFETLNFFFEDILIMQPK